MAQAAGIILLLLALSSGGSAAGVSRHLAAGAKQAAGTWPGSIVGKPGQPATIWRRPTILAIGDSLTQMGSNDWGDGAAGWVGRLSSFYNRKADVVNRGFAGFNTRTTLLTVGETLEQVAHQQVPLALLWLGANDAALADGIDGNKHVPLASYREHLEKLAQQLLAGGVQNVLLLTPPPVYEAAPQALPPGVKSLPRTYAAASRYAAAVRDAAAALKDPRVAILDVWQMMVDAPEWGTTLLGSDGLHLSRRGNDAVFQALVDHIKAKLPHLQPDAMPWHHPDWTFLALPDASQQLAEERAAYTAAFRRAQSLPTVAGARSKQQPADR